jgi:hypothetical protein
LLVGGVVEFLVEPGEGLLLELSGAFTAEAEFSADRFECPHFAGEAEAELEDPSAGVVEAGECVADALPVEVEAALASSWLGTLLAAFRLSRLKHRSSDADFGFANAFRRPPAGCS